MHKARARRAREKREGIVVLIVMLVLFMATGTAVFAVQSSQYEQRASTSLGESNWARGIAECTAMAGLAYAEETAAAPSTGPDPNALSVQWKAAGSGRAEYSQKYAIPEPISGSVGAASSTSAFDNSSSTLLMDAPIAATPPVTNNAPGGLAAFLPAERRTNSVTYPLLRNRDSQLLAERGLRFLRAHWLQETLSTATATATSAVQNTTSNPRTRVVVTAFAEINVWGDVPDSSGVRGLHELDAVARGYIDTFTQSPR
jgi:hypothetical protein